MEINRNLKRYLHELIESYAEFTGDTYTLSLSSLHDDEQGRLAMIYMAANGLDSYEFLMGFESSLFSMLEDDNIDTREDFARLVKKKIIAYYTNTLQDLINDACNDYLHEEYNAKGLYAKRTSNGDLYWSTY